MLLQNWGGLHVNPLQSWFQSSGMGVDPMASENNTPGDFQRKWKMNLLDQLGPQQVPHEVGYQDMGSSCWGQGPCRHNSNWSTSRVFAQQDLVPSIKLLVTHPSITLAKLVVVAKVQNRKGMNRTPTNAKKNQTPHNTLAQWGLWQRTGSTCGTGSWEILRGDLVNGDKYNWAQHALRFWGQTSTSPKGPPIASDSAWFTWFSNTEIWGPI